VADRDRPAVFLSHAGEDNDRFARGLAERLRDAGIDVWFDEWEILPGDSLVDKVFEEGLKSADAMVIVLSSNSIDKPWVREEINAGFVKRVEGKCKLIPVLIDDVTVPEALASTVWQGIANTEDFDQELDRIVRAIHDDRSRPEPGERAGYAEITALPGLYSTDTLCFANRARW
jgi:TIR domain